MVLVDQSGHGEYINHILWSDYYDIFTMNEVKEGPPNVLLHDRHVVARLVE